MLNTTVSSIVRVLLPLIPYNTVRYIILRVTLLIGAVYGGYLHCPSVRLRRLEGSVETLIHGIQGAKLMCPREHLTLTEQEGDLLRYVSTIIVR